MDSVGPSNEHEESTKQHIVPKFLIRRFCNERGKLYSMSKDPLRVERRQRGPNGILFKRGYYEDAMGDLDREWLQQAETEFGSILARFPADPAACAEHLRDNHKWLIEGVVSLACRTEWLYHFADLYFRENPDTMPGLPRIGDSHLNRFRFELRKEIWQSEFLHHEICVGVLRTTVEFPYVLSDNPVRVSHHKSGQLSLMLPIDSLTAVVMGHPDTVDRYAALTPKSINAHAAAWAGNWVYCRDRHPLDDLVQVLTSADIAGLSPEWQRQARLPFLGTSERFKESLPPPCPRPSDPDDQCA